MTKEVTTAIFEAAFRDIESNVINPFGKDVPRIPVSDDSDSGYGFQIEFLNPFVFFIEFDWFYSSANYTEETGSFMDWENKEVDSIKVTDHEGDEIEIDDVLEFRIKNYLLDAISWDR